MTLRDIWNNMSYRFCFWLIAALLAYRTAPDAGYSLALSAVTGIVYLVMWVLLVHLDAGNGKKFSGLMTFMLVLMAMAAVTFVTTKMGIVITTVALFWLVPVGMPLQGLVRLVNDGASRADAPMAVIAMAVLAFFLVLRTVFRLTGTKKG